jgi:hypothetical protein
VIITTGRIRRTFINQINLLGNMHIKTSAKLISCYLPKVARRIRVQRCICFRTTIKPDQDDGFKIKTYHESVLESGTEPYSISPSSRINIGNS